jgi:hypothetical protein
MSTSRKATLAFLVILALVFAAKLPFTGARAQQPATGAEQGPIDVYQLTTQAKDLPLLKIDEPF